MFKRLTSLILFSFILFQVNNLIAQDDLMNLVSNSDSAKATKYAVGTFKTIRIVNSPSVENAPYGNLVFIISHHFGTLNQGAYNYFGLDQSSIRLGFEYGLTKHLSVGLGRSSYEKTFDGSLKYILFKQCSGEKNFPVSISLFTDMTINSLKWRNPERKNYFTSRLAYVYEVLFARRFNDNLSVQITPAMVHYNIVPLTTDQNDHYAVGIGGRYLLTRRISLNAEYFHVVSKRLSSNYTNSLSVGFDIETGGHVFQIHFSNSEPLFDRGFIAETQGKWKNGYIHLGFNIMRYFNVIKAKPSQRWD